MTRKSWAQSQRPSDHEVSEFLIPNSQRILKSEYRIRKLRSHKAFQDQEIQEYINTKV